MCIPGTLATSKAQNAHYYHTRDSQRADGRQNSDPVLRRLVAWSPVAAFDLHRHVPDVEPAVKSESKAKDSIQNPKLTSMMI